MNGAGFGRRASEFSNKLSLPSKLIVSRREMLSRTAIGAGAVGALQTSTGAEARGAVTNTGSHGIRISQDLLDGLEFNRKNAREPGVALSIDSGLVVGFGENLFHADSSTASLFVKGQKVLESSTSLNVEENLPRITLGTFGSLVQTTKDRFGRTLTVTIEVDSVNDVPMDYLTTSNITSDVFSGSFFLVTATLATASGPFIIGKTTCNVLTNSLPLGVKFFKGSAYSDRSLIAFDRDAASLLGIVDEILLSNFWGPISANVPADLQQDLSFGKIFRAVVVFALTGGVAGPAPAIWVGTSNNPVADVRNVFGDIVKGVIGNFIYDILKAIITAPPQPPPPNPG